jgi:hypothetical protein
MMEESELYEVILEEIWQRLDTVKNEVEEIITGTLGQSLESAQLPTRKEAREMVRKKVIVMLDYIKLRHNNSDEYVAEQLGITEHTIKDEWRVPGRSIPSIKNYMALKALYDKEKGKPGNSR